MTAQTIEHGIEEFIKEEVALISSLNDARVQQMMNYSKKFLDTAFPLATGSHKDACSYVVYYQHLLVFLADGSQSGLKHPQQFVALSGHKESPDAVLLKSDDGVHVELVFNANGKRGALDTAGIDDIQVEASGADLGDIKVSHRKTLGSGAKWFSMVRGDSRVSTNKDGHQHCEYIEQPKHFTDKNGEEYRVG